MRELCITTFTRTNITDIKPSQRHSLDWDKIVAAMSKRMEATVKDQVPVFVGAEMQLGGRRCTDSVIKYDLLVLDYDSGISPRWFVSEYDEFEYVLYTTFSHSEESPKFRVVIPLAEPMSVEEYVEAKPFLLNKFKEADPAGFSVSQCFYFPSGNDNTFFTYHNKGKWFDMDEFKLEVAKIKLDSALFEFKEFINPATDSDIKRAEEVLSKMSPDCSYDVWWKIGACLKTLYGDDGFELWFKWSEQGSKYDTTESRLSRKWDSFNFSSPYNFGYLVNRQREYQL